MEDYEYLFSTELHKKLKEKVKGKVFVKIKHDKLYVEITKINECNNHVRYIRSTDPTYEYVMNNMADHILNGLSTSYLTYSILKEYRKFVNNQYFK